MARISTPAGVLAFLAVAAAVIVVLAGGSGERKHRVSFVVPNANNLISGLYVRAAGQRVGEISSVSTVDGGHAARVQLTIDNDQVWPLPPDTRFIIRFGGTVAYWARYVEIERGTSRRTPFADGATIPARNVTVPVEFNRFFNTFDRSTRSGLKRTTDTSGAALAAAKGNLRAALTTAPAAVREVASLFAQVGSSETALRGLVTSTGDVLGAADRADPGVGSLLSSAQTTLRAISTHATQLRSAVQQVPGSLTAARTTMAHLTATLRSAAALATRLHPGITQLQLITPALNGTLTTLTHVGPRVTRALASVRRGAPKLTAFVRAATSLMPGIGSIGRQATTQLACVRPYSPELAGFISTWDSFTSEGDQQDRYARLYSGALPFSNATPLTAGQAAKLDPTAFLDYGFPRAPGQNAGKSWYQPSCGITAAGQNPQDDPEAGADDPLSTTILSFDGSGAPQ